VIAGSFGLALGLAGCSSVNEAALKDGPPQQARASELPPFLPAGAQPDRSVAIPFSGGTSGLDEAQVDAMFDEAVARARLGKRQKPLQSECIMCLT
jgi:uncharacterized lipoprotein